MTRTMFDPISNRCFGTVAFFSLVAAVSVLPLAGCGGGKPAAPQAPPALPVTVVAAGSCVHPLPSSQGGLSPTRCPSRPHQGGPAPP